MKTVTAADAAVIICVLLLAVLSAVFIFFRGEGQYFIVNIDGKTEIYPLNENRIINISSNGIELAVAAENGGVCVTSSDCPDLTCVRTGSIGLNGQTVVCIPARVAVTVVGENYADADTVAHDADAIAGGTG